MTKSRVDLRDKQFLLIETNSMMRKLLRDMLLNFRVPADHIYEVGSMDEALEILYLRPFDMIITDFLLGTVDAADLAHHLRNDTACLNRKTPIVITTTAPNHDKVFKALEAGVNEVLAKPIAPSALYFRLASILMRPRPFVIARDYVGPSRSVQRLESLDRLSRSQRVRRQWRTIYRGGITYPRAQQRGLPTDPLLV